MNNAVAGLVMVVLVSGVVFSFMNLDEFDSNITGLAIGDNLSYDNLTAFIIADVDTGVSPLTVNFNGSLSGGPNAIQSYEWAFGDGQPNEFGITVEHTFTSPGTYLVTLLVTDDTDATDTDNISISVIANSHEILIQLDFDGNEYDSSGNELTTQVINPPLTYDSGVINQSAVFDGGSVDTSPYVSVSHDNSLDLLDEITIAYWAKKTDRDLGETIVIKSDVYWSAVGSNLFENYLFNSSDERVDLDVFGDIYNTDWHHFAVTYDGSLVKSYIDGTFIDQIPFQGPLSRQISNDVYVGGGPYTNTFGGLIDDFRIYNVALNDGAISELASASVCGDGEIGIGEMCDDNNTVDADGCSSTCQIEGLVTYWTFDEGNGTSVADSSINGYDGTASNMNWESADCHLGSCGLFPGSNAKVEMSSFNVVGDEISIFAWIKPNSFSINDARIISKADGTSGDDHTWMLSTRSEGGMRLRFRLKTEGETQTHVCGFLTLGEWQHIGAVYDGNSVVLYVNGISCTPISGGSQTGTIDQEDKFVWIGNNPPGTDDKTFDGLIDEVRIYDRALSLSEISDLSEVTCGNGELDTGETCDPPNATCSASYGEICEYCSDMCQTTIVDGGYCGDNSCDNNETFSTCSADCDMPELNFGVGDRWFQRRDPTNDMLPAPHIFDPDNIASWSEIRSKSDYFRIIHSELSENVNQVILQQISNTLKSSNVLIQEVSGGFTIDGCNRVNNNYNRCINFGDNPPPNSSDCEDWWDEVGRYSADIWFEDLEEFWDAGGDIAIVDLDRPFSRVTAKWCQSVLYISPKTSRSTLSSDELNK